jgi:hypothetical protein
MSAALASRTFTTPTFIDIDDVKLNSGVVLSVRTITEAGSYTISSTSNINLGNDNIISVNTTSAVTIYLPDDVNALVNGRTYTIHSTQSSANITIDGNTKNINGIGTAVISVGYSSLTFLYNSTVGAWFII